MFTNITYGSQNNVQENMDVCSVQEHCAWIIDGADALFPTNITDCEHDGFWFVREWSAYLKRNLMASPSSLLDIMSHGMELIHEQFQTFPGYQELCDLQMPSACCAVVKAKFDHLEYFVLGNCELAITYDDGKVMTLSDLRLQEMDAKLLEISQDARKKQRMPLFRARSFMDTMMVENRLRRNVHDGYYVLGEDSEASKHALMGTIPLAHVKHISLICNGFSQYYHCRKVTQNLDTYLQAKRSPQLLDEYEQLMAKKQRNAQLARYMQEKLSGKSTMVYFDVENKMVLTDR